MLRRMLAILMLVLAASAIGRAPVAAESLEARRERLNQGTITIISGGVDGTNIRIASDLARVLDNGDALRILPVLGKGSLQDINDLLNLKGIDVAIVQSDVLHYAQQHLQPRSDRRIRYITKLYDEEVHVLARPDIGGLADLAGKKVNLDVVGSGTAMTATTLFSLLDLPVQPAHFDQALALEKLKQGEIAAMVFVVGKPTDLFRGIDAGSGLHFLAIPGNATLLATYLPATLSHADYPKLIREGSPPLETIAVGAVMAVYHWERQAEQNRRIANFVASFFDRFDEFLQPPRHPKWREVNLAANLPGWSRVPAAEAWLARQVRPQQPVAQAQPAEPGLYNSFDAFLAFMAQSGIQPSERPLSAKDREALFTRFLQWQKTRTP